jgi:hypothetical protein
VILHTPEQDSAPRLNFLLSYPGFHASSTVSAFFMYTQNEQIVSNLGTEFYFREEAYKLDGFVSYVEFPDKFYGIGPDTPESNEEQYTPRSTSFATGLQKRLRIGLHAGIRYEFTEWDVIETEEGGMLDDGSITGSGRHRVGRGRVAQPRRATTSTMPGAEASARSTASLTRTGWAVTSPTAVATIDLRKFFSLGERHIIALQSLRWQPAEMFPFMHSRSWEAAKSCAVTTRDATATDTPGAAIRNTGFAYGGASDWSRSQGSATWRIRPGLPNRSLQVLAGGGVRFLLSRQGE